MWPCEASGAARGPDGGARMRGEGREVKGRVPLSDLTAMCPGGGVNHGGAREAREARGASNAPEYLRPPRSFMTKKPGNREDGGLTDTQRGEGVTAPQPR